MLRSLIFGLIFCIPPIYAVAQTSTCAQTLRLARSTYEQGRFHEIPSLLENCLKLRSELNKQERLKLRSELNKQERIEALKILTLSYIYQEEPELADASMLRLLKTNHYFVVNENVDPAELTALHYTFRNTPIFSIGVKFGGNYSLPTPFKNYFVGSAAANKGKYSPRGNIQAGIVFEKLLFEKNFDTRWTAAPEILYSSIQFGYANGSFTVSDQTGKSLSVIDGLFDQKRLDFNLLVQYKLKNSAMNPYVTGGVNLSYLLKGEIQIETQFPSKGSVISGPPVNIQGTFKPLDYGLIVGGGFKYQLGEIFILWDIRYKYGFANLVKDSARSNAEAAFDYGFVSNDLRQGSITVNIGFIYPYFKPKKLLR